MLSKEKIRALPIEEKLKLLTQADKEYLKEYLEHKLPLKLENSKEKGDK